MLTLGATTSGLMRPSKVGPCEEEECAAEHEIGQVGHVAMEVEHVAARVLVVALPDFQVDVAQGDGGGESAGG